MKYDSPLIICGGTRSGTTILTRVLRNHPQILLTLEALEYNKGGFIVFKDMLKELCVNDFDSKVKNVIDKIGINVMEKKRKHRSKEFIEKLCKTNIDNLDDFWDIALENEIIYGDKLPEYIHKIDSILSKYPNAKFMMCIRNPRDIWASQVRAYSLKNRPFWAKKTISDAIHSSCYPNGINIIQRLEIWDNIYDKINGLEVYYESLCRRPRKILKRIAGFLEISENDLIIQFEKQFTGRNIDSWKEFGDFEIPKYYKHIMERFGYR